jgi:hypothetical protein
MKKSDLKKHIKEEILSILKEASTALVTTKGGTKPVSFSSPAELNALKTDANVSSITTTAGQKIKETESKKEMKEDKFDDKITNLEKYTYTVNGKKVTPEIGYFDNLLKAVISTPRSGSKYFDYEYYRIGEPDESGNIELSPEKGKKGMYTEEMNTSGFKSGREFINIKLQKYPKAVAKINQLINMIGEDKFTMEMAKWLFDFFNNASYESPVNEAKIESDFFEREPKSKDIEKGEGIIAKTTKLLKFQKELKTLSKDMQDLAAEYREAEGSDKDEILRSLKVKTAAKKELEKKIEQLEKYV